jgi:hypothetical protein
MYIYTTLAYAYTYMYGEESAVKGSAMLQTWVLCLILNRDAVFSRLNTFYSTLFTVRYLQHVPKTPSTLNIPFLTKWNSFSLIGCLCFISKWYLLKNLWSSLEKRTCNQKSEAANERMPPFGSFSSGSYLFCELFTKNVLRNYVLSVQRIGPPQELTSLMDPWDTTAKLSYRTDDCPKYNKKENKW